MDKILTGDEPSDAEVIVELHHDLEGAKRGDAGFGPPPWMTAAEHVAWLESEIARVEVRRGG